MDADNPTLSGDAKERFEQLSDCLLRRICLLDYPPGTRLSEADLAAEFGTSRTPIRRALARLEDAGLLQSQHGVGTLVTDVSLTEMARTYELRCELAGLVGRLSPVTITTAHQKQITEFSQRAAALLASPDARRFAALNMDFFIFGTELTENQALRDMSLRLYYHTARIWLQSIPQLDLARETAIFSGEITQIGEAIAASDPLAAAMIRQAHISLCVVRLKKFAQG
ncbi:GntR family transcriptional regulator [Litorivita pollutaquae]|uniref:GntR family transcriptional regulator n=1 Tax=Litorivita pollutaquae TaxID=2200892 RepID=A0A2V4MLI8_9RHOB|nr:GntR family transcriptional regulator [Litorivita pollutaquae]PYC47531.1 GntR family transcriptional regulator [Litorivita pollutaquae]